MAGPRSVTLAKKDHLVNLAGQAKDIPTLVISLNPRSHGQTALIENGSKQRKVQWISTWGQFLLWCLQSIERAVSSDYAIVKIHLPGWKGLARLDEEWWAWGLFQACRQFSSNADFDLELLCLPPILSNVPIGSQHNSTGIKPRWCFTQEMIAICVSTGVRSWLQYSDENNFLRFLQKARALCNFRYSNSFSLNAVCSQREAVMLRRILYTGTC